jgi:tetratricopeptide (TPR) repeat protein
MSLAQLLYNTADYAGALPHFHRVLSARPNYDAALALAGYTLRRLGRIDESNDYFKRCLAINPAHPDHAEMQAFLSE